MDITTIPTHELITDRRACIDDIGNCELALSLDIREQGTIPLKDRIRGNRAIVKKIDIELRRRMMLEEGRAA